MAGTTTASNDTDAYPGSVTRDLAIHHNKTIDDLETLRAALSSGGVVAVTELMADHATFKTAADAVETLVEELGADHATFKTVTDEIKALINQIRNHIDYRLSGNPGFAIDTNFDVKNGNAISYFNGGLAKSLAANTNFDTGTAATIATTKWGAALLSITSGATATVTWFTNAGAGYNSEALAIAAMTDPGATQTLLGYVTVQAAGATWTAGTDALTTGTGGTPATATNYYNTSNPNNLRLGAVVASSAPATLTASIAIPSAPATLSASAPSGTAVDAASDLVAAKVGNSQGTAITA
jgi:hypothetical protein